MHIHVLIFNFMCKIDIVKREGVFVSFDLTSETRTPENPPPEKVRRSESTGKAARGLHAPPSASGAKAPLTRHQDTWRELIGSLKPRGPIGFCHVGRS